MKIYNTLSRKKENFSPKKEVSMFVCGPTVYNRIHLGNARTFTNYDLIAKYLKFKKINLFYLQNITDIDDKIIIKAKKEKTTWKKIAKKYEKEFLEDISQIKINSIDKYARATDYMAEIISQIKRLKKLKYTYEIDNDGIYYDLSKNKDYGKLSKRSKINQEDIAISRIDSSKNKRNKGDFCLWKFSKKGEPSWDSEFGKGRPGWHIEDTAITEKELGKQYDIHGGAIDLIFPHHEAELAQMESLSGKKPFVKYWVHSGFLNLNKEKMAKSGSFITLKNILEEYTPLAVRYFFISAHYRSPLDFSKESLNQASSSLERLQEFYIKAKTSKKNIDQKVVNSTKKKVLNALDDDFNTPRALGELFKFIREANKLGYGKNSYKLLKELNKFLDILEEETKIPKEVLDLARKREKARKEKNWKLSDNLREKINKKNYSIQDTELGPKIKKIKQ